MIRLDIRVTELVNRIVMEHEERVKNQVNLHNIAVQEADRLFFFVGGF